MNTSSIQTAEIVFLAFLTIAAIDFGFCYGSTNTGCIEVEKRALLSFKQGLNDTSNRLSSWGVEDDCCNWAGVVCDNVTGHVLALHLQNPSFDSDYYPFHSDYSLGGEINSSLVNLKQLKHLDLSGNYFGGIAVPSFIGSMANLQYLNLSYAGFVGAIPHQLGKLSSMRFLSLGSNRLDVGNLQWVLGLSHLEVLDLSWGIFTTAPDWLQVINKLPSLVELDLSGCILDHIPQQVSVNFTSLAVLDLSWTFFDSMIPSWIFGLSGLVSLDLSWNEFPCPFPLVVPNMTSLRYLDLSWNDLNCTIPSWIFSLSGLVSLDLSWNELQCPFPSVVPNMTSLRYLDLSRNDLNCTIPSWMYSFNCLEFLDLTDNGLQGGISDEIGNLTSAISLLLSVNNLDGKLPSSIGTLASVKTIDLSNNKLIGTLPDAIIELVNVNSLNLSYNEFEGRLPRWLGNLCNLRLLDMSGNKFSGELFTISSKCEEYALESMFLYNNQLSGQLPNQLGQFGNIRELDLRNNSLSGPIPVTLGSLASITSISLAKNRLNGTIPESLGQLSKLQSLDLSDNLLEGIVSEVQFTNLKNLDTLNASQNQLTLKVSPDWNPPFQLGYLDLANWHLGPKFPTWLQSQKALTFIDLSCTGISDQIPTWFWNTSSSASHRNLSNNQIHGELPYLDALEPFSVMYLNSNNFSGPLPLLSSNLSELDLSENLFSGALSHFLCDWKEAPSLRVLLLGDNLLSGEIPDCWTGWESMTVVELGNNNLTGSIPRSMGLLRSLKSLHLRNNHLSGEIPSSLQNCYNLEVVDLSENEFNGSIHKWVGERLSSLRILSLRGNKLEGVVPPELCQLSSIQVLDLANNNLSGAIPRCINNLTSMAVKLNRSDPINFGYGYDGSLEKAILVMKGGSYQYDKILALVALMDLSNNNISGNIPEEITSLLGLISLNLSGNHLSGVIPNKIGNMGWLGSLDLSRNQLYGEIPQTMSGMTFLSCLNLSYNNLSGAIPLGTQLQSFDASSFIGNNLCGLPLSNNCRIGEETPSQRNKGESAGGDDEVDWFYLCMALGFGTGFLSVSIMIFSIKSWRYAYFLFLENVWTRLVWLYARRRV